MPSSVPASRVPLRGGRMVSGPCLTTLPPGNTVNIQPLNKTKRTARLTARPQNLNWWLCLISGIAFPISNLVPANRAPPKKKLFPICVRHHGQIAQTSRVPKKTGRKFEDPFVNLLGVPKIKIHVGNVNSCFKMFLPSSLAPTFYAPQPNPRISHSSLKSYAACSHILKLECHFDRRVESSFGTDNGSFPIFSLDHCRQGVK